MGRFRTLIGYVPQANVVHSTLSARQALTFAALLFLDEVTSGLDPLLEREMMETLRALAHGSTEHPARTVVLVTHATQSIFRCDLVIVMAAGGRLAFCGSPAEALRSCGTARADDPAAFTTIYEGLSAATEGDSGCAARDNGRQADESS